MINTHTATLEQIRHAGLSALTRELGPTGTVRFLQQFDNGSGDYTAERQQWVDTVSLDQIMEQIRSSRDANSE